MRTPTRKDRDPNLKSLLERELEERELNSALEAEDTDDLPMVAIVGRPNVGKSTLFNRIIGRRKALVHDRPGMTRDRNIDRALWDGLDFLVVDTGGFEIELDDPLLENVVEQVRLAIDEADVIIFLAAVQETAHPADEEIVRLMRAVDKPVIAAVNKCDSPASELEASDFYRFGFEHVHAIAALHGHGVGDLLSEIVGALRRVEQPTRSATGPGGLRLALLGRQNVGKSTLVNRLIGAERVIASDVPGTTRDAVDTTLVTPEGHRYTLIDTAGIRRRGKIERGVEKLSVLSSMLSLRRAQVALLVVDGSEGLTDQDAHIAGYCVDEGKPLIILVNKWDKVEKDHRTADLFTKHLEEKWAFVRFAPVLYLSALTGQRAHRVFELAERVYANASVRIGTHELNERLTEWVGMKPPGLKKGKRPKVRFMTQTGVRPPTFTMFVNEPELFHFSYRRFIVNRLREAYDFEGTPLRLNLRKNRTRRIEDPDPIEK